MSLSTNISAPRLPMEPARVCSLSCMHADILGAGVGCYGLNLGTKAGEFELFIPEARAVW